LEASMNACAAFIMDGIPGGKMEVYQPQSDIPIRAKSNTRSYSLF
jgi:hypothetical protein